MTNDIENAIFEKDLFGQPIIPVRPGPLTERFLIPPFTVFDTRGGYWQDRKRAWISLGIKSEIGRGDELTFSKSLQNPEKYKNQGKMGTTSIFDPVLCECLYRWFCPAGGQVIDPFAGGSVRGIVASIMGRKYWGCDLSLEQITANATQAAEIVAQPPIPVWVRGDSESELDNAPQADFVIACPPYGDLERYSDNPLDLSTMKWDDFFEKYHSIIKKCVNKLKDGRFACFVIGNFRGSDGFYRDLVGATSAMFMGEGRGFYNEGILINVCGTLPVRVSFHFDGSRKLGRNHQNIVIFCKGSWKDAVAACERNEKPVDDIVDAFTEK